jgi:hypothetical protein
MRRVLVTLSILGLSPVPAEETPPPVPVKVVSRPVTSFGYLDADKDARLSREEAKADWAVAQGFDRADANGDDQLDLAEFVSLWKS